jgi:hypothetical protein
MEEIMGYTHYWRTHKDGIPPEQWKLICRDIKTLIQYLPEHSTSAGDYHLSDPLKIAYEDGSDKPPQITSKLIRFNGTGGDDLGHETFYFERKPTPQDYQKNDEQIFAFCKTARKPYDLVVCGALVVIIKHAAKWVTVSSDGDPEDWQPALEWVLATLGQAYADEWQASRVRDILNRAIGKLNAA